MNATTHVNAIPQSAAEGFHLPPNTDQFRTAVKQMLELQGAKRKVTFYHYEERGFYRVSTNSKGWGMLLIGPLGNGKWQAKHCHKVGINTYLPTGVQSKACASPQAAFADVLPQWGEAQVVEHAEAA